jgi:hypothetical protein
MQNTVIKILIIGVNFFLLFLSLLISPYREELDLDEKQINANGVLILRIIYTLMIALAVFYFVRLRSFKGILSTVALLAGLFALVKLFSTFFL